VWAVAIGLIVSVMGLLLANLGLAVLVAHCSGVVSIGLEVVAEPGVFEGDGVLVKGQHVVDVFYLKYIVPG
jgi:hypothetical protein